MGNAGSMWTLRRFHFINSVIFSESFLSDWQIALLVTGLILLIIVCAVGRYFWDHRNDTPRSSPRTSPRSWRRSWSDRFNWRSPPASSVEVNFQHIEVHIRNEDLNPPAAATNYPPGAHEPLIPSPKSKKNPTGAGYSTDHTPAAAEPSIPSAPPAGAPPPPSYDEAVRMAEK